MNRVVISFRPNLQFRANGDTICALDEMGNVLFQYTFQNVTTQMVWEFDIPASEYQWDAAQVETMRGSNGNPVSLTVGNHVNSFTSKPGSVNASATLVMDSTLTVSPTYDKDAAGRPGVRTNGTSVLGAVSTANWVWMGKIIALVYTKHDNSTGMHISRRGMHNGTTTNAAGGWVYRTSNTTKDLYAWIATQGIQKKTTAGIANVDVMQMYQWNGNVWYYLSESVNGQPAVVSTHNTGYFGNFITDGSTDFPLGLGGYFGGTDAITGREFADITIHELRVIDGSTQDASNLSAFLVDKWWPTPRLINY